MQRVKELDAIRGIAALMIVVCHLSWGGFGTLGSAVNLFFVLSGFLITSIILAHRPTGRFLFAFYVRRGLRIWPIYYLSLLFLVIINPWTSEPGNVNELPSYATFTQLVYTYWSDTPTTFIHAFRHTWSLAVEEQFYLLWPALLCVVGRKGLPLSAAALMILCVIMRALGVDRWTLGTNCAGLALGALLAHLLKDLSPARARMKYRRAWVGLGVASTACWMASITVVRFIAGDLRNNIVPAIEAIRMLSLNVTFFAIVGLVVVYANHPRLGLLRGRRLVYLGQISYGVYLYHYIVFILWDNYAASHGLGDRLVYDCAKVVASVAIAACSHRFIEAPILTLKEWFPYRESSPRNAVMVEKFTPVHAVEIG